MARDVRDFEVNDFDVCTIVARNYLPAARVLAESFLEHHPAGHVHVLVVDDLAGEVDAAAEPFEVVRPEDLDLTRDEFLRMAMLYDVTELCTCSEAMAPPAAPRPRRAHRALPRPRHRGLRHAASRWPRPRRSTGS